jgi:hypothetical protein
MGKAYIAVAEEGDTIFSNPAGLGEIDAFQFTSMAGNVMEDVHYTMLGGVYPLGKKAAFGLGYIGANVSGIEIRNAAGTLQNYSNYGNNVFFFSFAKKLAENISLGFNLKYFSQAGSNGESQGTGINLDVGYLQKDLGWLSLGAVGQNILGSAKINYNNGITENMPSIIKIGAKMYLLGERFNAAFLSPVQLIAATDVDINLQTMRTATCHLGGELSPSPFITLRVGLDQDPIPGGVQSNFTGGVSLKFSGVGLHYAYHPYAETPENTSHYFSLSFNEGLWANEGEQDIFMGLLQNSEIGKNFNFFDSELVSNNMRRLQKLKYFAISQQSLHGK